MKNFALYVRKRYNSRSREISKVEVERDWKGILKL